MGFSTLGKPTKANVISDNSVKALHRTAASLEETDQWVEEIESSLSVAAARLDELAEKVAQGDQQSAKEISLVHQRVDEQAQVISEMDQGVSEAFEQVSAGHQDVTRYVLEMEKKIYQAQDNVQELSKLLDAAEKRLADRIANLPPPPTPLSRKWLWAAIGSLGALTIADIVVRWAGV
jgi:small-conductance mechanosensitive channel